MFITFLFGCAASLQGIWDGTCTFDDQQNLAEVDVTADIRSDNGYLLGGEMQITDWERNDYNTPLDGDHSGKYVYMSGEITDFSQVVSEENSSSNTFLFFVETQRIGRILEGSCGIESTTQSSENVSLGTLIGDIYLEK